MDAGESPTRFGQKTKARKHPYLLPKGRRRPDRGVQMITDHPSELAEMIMSWSDAGVDAFAIAMRLSEVDSAVVRQAMKIVREELVPATAAREADFRRRRRYSTVAELREM